MNKKLILSAVTVMALIGAITLFATLNTQRMNFSKEQGDIVSSDSNTGTNSVSTWKIYRNEKYGFEVEYPYDWKAEEFFTAGLGLPVDCKVQPLPKECDYFTVRLFSEKNNGGNDDNIVIKIREKSSSDSQLKAEVKKSGNSVAPAQWTKKINGKDFVKTNSYFPLYASCFTTASISDLNLKNNDVVFEKMYSVSGDLYTDELEKYCSHESEDKIFDHIVASFRVF